MEVNNLNHIILLLLKEKGNVKIPHGYNISTFCINSCLVMKLLLNHPFKLINNFWQLQNLLSSRFLFPQTEYKVGKWNWEKDAFFRLPFLWFALNGEHEIQFTRSIFPSTEIEIWNPEWKTKLKPRNGNGKQTQQRARRWFEKYH